MTFAFNSKETYLIARAEWRGKYKKLSADIRQAKLDLKKAQRENTADNLYFSTCKTLKQIAREMLDERIEMKLESQRQWLANRQH